MDDGMDGGMDGWKGSFRHDIHQESCSVRLSRGMVCSRQPWSFQGVDSHGQSDGWTEGRRDGFRGSFISSRHPLIVSSIPSSVATVRPDSGEASFYCPSGFGGSFILLSVRIQGKLHSIVRPASGEASFFLYYM